jgi:hypothetical protein
VDSPVGEGTEVSRDQDAYRYYHQEGDGGEHSMVFDLLFVVMESGRHGICCVGRDGRPEGRRKEGCGWKQRGGKLMNNAVYIVLGWPDRELAPSYIHMPSSAAAVSAPEERP